MTNFRKTLHRILKVQMAIFSNSQIVKLSNCRTFNKISKNCRTFNRQIFQQNFEKLSNIQPTNFSTKFRKIVQHSTDKFFNKISKNCPTFNRQIFQQNFEKLSNIQPTNYLSSIMTPPNWAALFSDNYPLRGVLRLG
jgi:hypothetical protein